MHIQVNEQTEFVNGIEATLNCVQIWTYVYVMNLQMLSGMSKTTQSYGAVSLVSFNSDLFMLY